MGHQAADYAVNHGEDGHAQHHAGKPKQSSEQEDGEQHPEGGQPGGVPQDLGPQNVAVELLEGQDKDGEVDRLKRIDQENQQSAGNGSDEGAKEGDDVGHAHHDGNQGRIRELENVAAHQADYSNNQRIQQLPVDKAAHDPVGVPGFPDNQVGHISTK